MDLMYIDSGPDAFSVFLCSAVVFAPLFMLFVWAPRRWRSQERNKLSLSGPPSWHHNKTESSFWKRSQADLLALGIVIFFGGLFAATASETIESPFQRAGTWTAGNADAPADILRAIRSALLFAIPAYAVPAATLFACRKENRAANWLALLWSATALYVGARAFAAQRSAAIFFALMPLALLIIWAQSRMRQAEIAALSLPRAPAPAPEAAAHAGELARG